MRYLMLLCLLLATFKSVAEEITIGSVTVSLPIGATLSRQMQETDRAAYLVVLGALEKVNQEIEPEASEVVVGTRSSWTWKLPFARSTDNISDALREQLDQQAETLYHCSGRTCGSSMYWANKVFQRSFLYGPEQHQRYTAYQLPESGGYILLYVSERATGDIYLHLELIAG